MRGSAVLSVVTPPAPVVTLADAKAHLRVDADDDDPVITGLIAAATAALDGPQGWLGRALGQQTLRLTAPAFPGAGPCDWSAWSQAWPSCHPAEIRLPCPPIVRVAAVTYLDPAGTGTWLTLDPAAYALADRILFPLGGLSWPAAGDRPDGVRVDFVAGYDANALPPPIRAAILLAVGGLYANRNDAPAATAPVSERLLSPYRVF